MRSKNLRELRDALTMKADQLDAETEAEQIGRLRTRATNITLRVEQMERKARAARLRRKARSSQ